MSLFNKPAPLSIDESDGLPVPDHLEPYFDRAPGPSEGETRQYFLSPPKEIPWRQGGGYRPPDEELDAPVEVPYDEWAHQIRLRNAEMLKAKDAMAQAVEASMLDCGLCAEEMWIGDSGGLLELDGGETVRLCQVCYPLVRDEQHRRRHAARLDQLLTGGTVPQPSEG